MKKNVDNLPDRNFMDFEQHSLIAAKIYNDDVEFYGTKTNTLQGRIFPLSVDDFEMIGEP